MLINKPYGCKIIGNVNTIPYLNFIKKLSFIENNNYHRDKYFNGCLSYFLVERSEIKSKKFLNQFLKISKDLIEILHLTYGRGSSDNIQFSLLLPNSKILPHVDIGEAFEDSHRIHIVLKTNEETEFIVNDRAYKFTEGIVFELNNQLKHSVYNNSIEEDRVHLIIDYIPNFPSHLKR